MSRDMESPTDRRRFLKYTGAMATAALAGCGGQEGTPGDGDDGGDGTDGGDDTDTPTDEATPTAPPEPESREEALQWANRLANEEAPWIFLNRQYSVYGKSTRIEWEARRDEAIEAKAISPTSDGGDVTITQGQMDSGLDPQDHRETPTDNIVRQAYEGLLQRDREGNIEPALATDYERVEEGLVRFQIREDVQFHNGDDLTPEDVAYSINRIVQEDVGLSPSPQRDQLAGVTGAEVVDGEHAVEVTSDGLNPVVFQLFATYGQIMQQSWVEDNDGNYIGQNVNGTGPFQLVEYEQDVRVEFEAFDDWWGGSVDVERLEMTAAEEPSTRVNQLLQGETDVVVNVPPQEVARIEDSGDAEISAVPSTRILYISMRYDVEPFSSVEFRRAMNYAIDLESIVSNVLSDFGDVTGQPTLEGFVGYNEDVDPYPHDPDQAESLVEESGHAGAEITIHSPVGRYLKDVEISQAVASQIDELSNVSASVEQRDFGALTDELLTGNIEDKPDIFMIGWGNATFDASQTLIPLLTSDGVLTTWENDRFDELVDASQNMPGEGS